MIKISRFRSWQTKIDHLPSKHKKGVLGSQTKPNQSTIETKPENNTPKMWKFSKWLIPKFTKEYGEYWIHNIKNYSKRKSKSVQTITFVKVTRLFPIYLSTQSTNCQPAYLPNCLTVWQQIHLPACLFNYNPKGERTHKRK